MEEEKKLPYNIKDNVRTFLLEDVFSSCKTNKNFEFEAGMFMMVVDEKSIAVLNTFVQLTDLMETGIAGLEKLELVRKKFPKMHAIYFISSDKKSIDLLAKDFDDISKPQYGFIHIIFYNGLPDDVLKYLMGKTNIVSMIVNIKVIQLQFMALDEVCFSFGMKSLMNEVYTDDMGAEEKENKINELASCVSTLVTGLKEFHNIQVLYNKPSNGPSVAKAVAEKAQDRIGQILASKPKPGLPPPPVTLIIMDRTEDLLTPLKHDLYYGSLLVDLLNIVDFRHRHEVSNEKQERMEKISILNESDSIWMQYRQKGFMAGLQKIVADFDAFVKNNSAAQMQTGKMENLTAEKMQEIIRKMPEYQDLMANYTFHIGMLEKAGDMFKRRDLSNLANIEATLCSGIDAGSRPKTIDNIQVINNLTYELDQVRLGAMMLLSSFADPGARGQVKNQFESNIDFAVGGKVLKGITKMKIDLGKGKLLKKEPVKDPENKYAETDRSYSRIAETVMNLRSGKDTGFEKIILPAGEGFPDVKFNKGMQLAMSINQSAKPQSNPIFIVCVIGGISTNEIRELRALEEHPDFAGHITLMGGSLILTPMEYLKELQRADAPLKEDIEELDKELQKEKELQEEFEKDKKEAEELKKQAAQAPAVDATELKDISVDKPSDKQESLITTGEA